MMDLYLMALPIFALLLFISFIYIKLAIQQLVQLSKDKKLNKNKLSAAENDTQSNNTFCKTLRYLLRNFTPAAIFKSKLCRRTLQNLLICSFESIYLYFFGSRWYIALGFGTVISSTMFAIDAYRQHCQMHDGIIADEQSLDRLQTVKIVQYSICGIITISLYLVLCGLTYKNYLNSRLFNLLANLGVVFSMDSFCIRPLVFFIVAVGVKNNKVIIEMMKTNQQELFTTSKVANNCEIQQLNQQDSKNKFVINFGIEPQPINLSKSKHSNRSKNKQSPYKNQEHFQILVSGAQLNQGSYQNVLSRNQSSKSHNQHKRKLQQVNDRELFKIDEFEDGDLKQYFCLSLRKQQHCEENKSIQQKIQTIMKNKSNIDQNGKGVIQQFLLQDFFVNSPLKINDDNSNQDKSQNPSHRNSAFSKSKASLKNKNTIHLIERQKNNQNDINDNKQNFFIQSTKSDLPTNHQFHRDSSTLSRDKRSHHNRTSILKIQEMRESGELQEIDINSPSRNPHFKKQFFDTCVIPQENQSKATKRRGRRHVRAQTGSQPHFNPDKLIGIYMPGANKSQLQLQTNSRRKSLIDRSQFLERTTTKSHSKGRDKPIVHEHLQNQTQFYIPNF